MREVVKASNKTRAEKIKKHDENTKSRTNDIKAIKAQYLKEKNNPVILDLVQKIKDYMKYHDKMAHDAVGVEKTGHRLTDGTDETQVVHFSGERRLRELDKAAGQQEILDYIERQFKMPEGVVSVKPAS